MPDNHAPGARTSPNLGGSARSYTTLVLIAVIALSVTVVGFAFVFFRYHLYPDRLAAVGQLLGSMFSCLTLLGLVLSQVLQHQAVNLQRSSLDAQTRALDSQMSSVELTNATFAIELLKAATESAEQTFERYACSLIVMCPTVSEEIITDLRRQSAVSSGYPIYTSYLVQNDVVLRDIVSSIDTEIVAGVFRPYIILYEDLRSKSVALKEYSEEVDIFHIRFDDTVYSQLYFALRQAMPD